jgi:hemerythrin
MALRWNSTLSIGVPEIDRHHQELFERIDAFEDAVLSRDRASAARTLAFLREYARLHFAAEEALMRAVGYPARLAHEAEHARFFATVEALAEALAETGPTAAIVHRVHREIGAWVPEHVYSTDQALGWYLRRGRSAEVQ